MTDVYLNHIVTAVPAHDIHDAFTNFAPGLLTSDRERKLFQRMVERAHIAHRYSMLTPGRGPDCPDAEGFYRRGAFPSTGQRMARYTQEALPLAMKALDRLNLREQAGRVTHLILTSCTGFYAPGLDLQILQAYGLRDSTERTVVGFMGCYAAMNALKLARHIVRSEASACVLVVNLELCTLHFNEVHALEPLLSFLLFGDGVAAALISAEAEGLALQEFSTAIIPDSAHLITWDIGDSGFIMHLSGQVPPLLERALPGMGISLHDVTHWAVHPGGRTILDAVEHGLALPPQALTDARAVLHDYGNMSSATIMFVLQRMLASAHPGIGFGMAFGPGLTAEMLRFEKIG
jgi:predicted naringenin-chalcone synthase